ncbi:putative F-box/LRR-repeat protein 23 [Papaver somniferum]|uniref:putative F-box/LRR-repeat protein 23 n=1 Tax=Papaver somniferum TaxID=3469 RepID=UPI000E7059FD|nr:putative F-box/LRR-repeat protein 23 [Papaver somniferum]
MKKLEKKIMDNHQTPITSEKEEEEEQVRNWLDLPSDILALIFLKLGAIDILLWAQAVCSVWRNFSKQPMLFRAVDLRKRWGIFDDIDMQKIAEEAVDRSCGQLVEFSMSDCGSNDILTYVAYKSGALRCLRLENCYRLSRDALINMAKKVVFSWWISLMMCLKLLEKHALS